MLLPSFCCVQTWNDARNASKKLSFHVQNLKEEPKSFQFLNAKCHHFFFPHSKFIYLNLKRVWDIAKICSIELNFPAKLLFRAWDFNRKKMSDFHAVSLRSCLPYPTLPYRTTPPWHSILHCFRPIQAGYLKHWQ